MAQADSCIGAKTSLNYKDYKNLIGTFYPPAEIFIDTTFISTQKEIDFYSGIGEIVKLHIMGGDKCLGVILKYLNKLLDKEGKALSGAIYNSLLIKKKYIEEDEFDLDPMAAINKRKLKEAMSEVKPSMALFKRYIEWFAQNDVSTKNKHETQM